MKRYFALLSMFLCSSFDVHSQNIKSFYPIAPVTFTEVEITDSFWKERLDVNREVTIPIAFKRSEETGRIKNFKVAAGLEKGTYNTGRGYDDSDVFKVMEGAAYSLSQHPDPQLEQYLDSLITVVGMAQEDDGYLFTVKTILGVSNAHMDAKEPKWVEVERGSHELYNVGHMYEAAVAHYRATGKRNFLDIAIKNADLIDKEFGWGKRELVPGHQEIEIGLVKLYGATGEKRYLDLAKFFLDKRGKSPRRETYDQTHLPVVEQDKAVGHSVRAVYMYAGMADMAALSGDGDYVMAMDKLWHDIVDTKLYIIGGIGAAGGHEGFGDHYELPNLSAYNETCAAIANVFWNYRLFLTHGDAKYMDVLERSLYNNVLSGVSLDGNRFFYPNKLESRGLVERSEWFSTSCCPSNISRFLPDIPGYIYARNDKDVYVNLFISSKTNFLLSNKTVDIEQNSQIPWSGKVDFTIEPEVASDFSFRIRIPGWASERPVPSDLYHFSKPLTEEIIIKVNGEPVDFSIVKGYAVLDRTWKKNDKVQVEFPYEVRTIESHERIENNRGKIALQAGPIVYCVEGFDLNNGQANNIYVDKDQDFSLVYEKDLLNGVMTINGKAQFVKESGSEGGLSQEINFKAIPYYGWANRGGSEMEVWIPSSEDQVFPEPQPTIGSSAKLATSKTEWAWGLYLVNDRYIPSNKPIEVPNFNFWPLSKSTEWITMRFNELRNISSSNIYWTKTKDGGVDYPVRYKIYYEKNGDWFQVKGAKYPINEDGKVSVVNFDPIRTGALKLEIKFGKKPAGLYEWEVK